MIIALYLQTTLSVFVLYNEIDSEPVLEKLTVVLLVCESEKSTNHCKTQYNMIPSSSNQLPFAIKLPDLCWFFVPVSSWTWEPSSCMQGQWLDNQSECIPLEENQSFLVLEE
jgi:hypothetical protein